MATPHIETEKREIAEIVLMPGDPLRAKFIADNYLSDVKQFNKVRNMLGYTGYYKGKRVSVMGSGMGMPSIGIYAYELFKFYDVKKIIRVGSCGAYQKDLKLYDIILVDNSYSNSTFARELSEHNSAIISSSKELTNHIEKVASELGIAVTRGDIVSSDVFYTDSIKIDNKYLGVEMESFALFHIANILNKEAACILTVSDSLVTKEETSSKEREQSLTKMIELALETIIKESD
ncbi:MAG: purine-nucleoside phosphorylase [Bacilli bacterium]|nr:purine-nucleoside phosphorylase [Bacilli bacterium]